MRTHISPTLAVDEGPENGGWEAVTAMTRLNAGILPTFFVLSRLSFPVPAVWSQVASGQSSRDSSNKYPRPSSFFFSVTFYSAASGAFPASYRDTSAEE